MKRTILLAVLLSGCAAAQPQPDREKYLSEMNRATLGATSCADAKTQVAAVQARWLPTWPGAPLPVVPCNSDGGTNDAH